MATDTSRTTFDAIADLVRDTLALPDEQAIRSEQLLFYDLSFSSMDFLDLLFRIEDRFGIAIVEGTIYRLARGDLDDATFATGGVLTPVGRQGLMALLHDSPAEIFPTHVDVAGLPRYCTVGALGRLVDRLLATKL